VDDQRIVLDADINVHFLNTRHFNFQSEVVLVFVDVHRRCESSGRQRLLWAVGIERFTQNDGLCDLAGWRWHGKDPSGLILS